MNRTSWWSRCSVGATFLMLLVTVPAAYATTWDEAVNGGGDAGDQMPSAQVPLGSGALTTVTGVNSTGLDGDLYKIYLPNPADFVATTVNGASYDTILYLFDTAGHAWVAQDDDASLQSTIFFAQNQPVPPPGNFYLGITTFNLHIHDVNHLSMFDHPGFQSYSGTSPISNGQVNLWTSTAFEFDHFEYLGYPSGDYTIQLQNAKYMAIPEPGGALLVLTGIVGLVGARRR